MTAMVQQPTLEWDLRYNGKGNGWDEAVAVAVDEQGNSYVTGNSMYDSPETSVRSRITTIKYSPSGKRLWAVRPEDISEAAAIAVDNRGGVYITGNAGYREDDYGFLTVRYDTATGRQTWVMRHNGGTATAIAVDNQAGVYVTGSSGYDYLTVRYDTATGRRTWVQSYFTAVYEPIDYFIDIAVDNSGGVYVTGQAEAYAPYTGNDYVTIRYNAATGQETWTQFYNSDGYESDDHAMAIAVDNQGGCLYHRHKWRHRSL